MTQEEKQQLFNDLCARLSYGVKILDIPANVAGKPFLVSTTNMVEYDPENETNDDNWSQTLYNIKPYLRPMSSMTEEEKQWSRWYQKDAKSDNFILYMYQYVEWLDSKHFDWRTDGNGKTLIELGLALEAKEGMYKTK